MRGYEGKRGRRGGQGERVDERRGEEGKVREWTSEKEREDGCEREEMEKIGEGKGGHGEKVRMGGGWVEDQEWRERRRGDVLTF